MLPPALALILLAACGTSGPRPVGGEPAAAATVTSAVAADAEEPRRDGLQSDGLQSDGLQRDGRQSDGRQGDGRRRAADDAGEPAAPVEIPDEVLAAYLAALDDLAARDFGAAEAGFDRLAAEYPGLAGPIVNLAIVYRQTGRQDAARAALERALAIDPAHPAANNELGVLLREAGEFAAAEAAYRRAIAADAGHALAHYNLGVLLDLYLRRQDEALEQYQIYQTLAAEPDPEVDFWVVDLRRRLGLPIEPARLAREDAE